MLTQKNPDTNALQKPILDDLILGELGSLEVRLASNEKEIKAAQRLRYQIFSAQDDADCGLDEDHYDQYCDHLIVVDNSKKTEDGSSLIIATYRLLGDKAACMAGGYYSSSEFDISPLLKANPDKKFLEFGRSCVLPEYRNKRTVELLWHGSWAYVCKYGYDVMFGCASFTGNNPESHREPLSFLHHHATAKNNWSVKAKQKRGISMNMLSTDQLNLKAAMKTMPPLIKGYLRLGASFASNAVIDHEFDSVDVLVVLPIEQLNPRYVAYYGADASRHAK